MIIIPSIIAVVLFILLVIQTIRLSTKNKRQIALEQEVIFLRESISIERQEIARLKK